MRIWLSLFALSLFALGCDDCDNNHAEPVTDTGEVSDDGISSPEDTTIEIPIDAGAELDAAPIEPDADPIPIAICSDPTPVSCEEQMIPEMALQPGVAPGQISNDASDRQQGLWLSEIDATAGGAFSNPPHAYVYGRFTDNGMEKVDLGDEAALESMDWDIAFRRHIIRLNGGASGPS